MASVMAQSRAGSWRRAAITARQADQVLRRGEQRVLINVDLYVPLAVSTPRADKLEEVVDYDFIRRTVMARVAHGHIHLQETLADELLVLMLGHPRVRAARVSTEKPDVYPDCDAVGCEVFGIKDGEA